MKHNMGKTERVIRLLAGIVLLLIGFRYLGAVGIFGAAVTGTSILGFIVALAGIIVFVTGVFAYCPVNALFKLNTCEACKIGETHKHMPV